MRIDFIVFVKQDNKTNFYLISDISLTYQLIVLSSKGLHISVVKY